MSCETSCETVTGSIVALLDGELAEAERRDVEVHLASCTACARELAGFEGTRRIVERHFAASGAGVAPPAFDQLWRRLASDAAAPAVRSGAAATRSGSVVRSGRGRRRWLWTGASAGLALAAALALIVFAPRSPGGTPAAHEAPTARSPVVASAPAQKAVAARSAQGPATRVAKAAPDAGPRKEQVARRAEPKPAVDAAPSPGEEPAEAVAVNELDPPRDLLDRPDLFLNYPIVRKLEELRHLDAVLAEHGADDRQGDGGAG